MEPVDDVVVDLGSDDLIRPHALRPFEQEGAGSIARAVGHVGDGTSFRHWVYCRHLVRPFA